MNGISLRWSILCGVAFFLLVAAWFAVGGLDRRHHTPDWITAKPIAHRGLHSGDGRVPENSLAAFEAAADRGFAIELDVQMSADGQVVVVHDSNLQRLTGDPRDVAAVSAKELKSLRILGGSETIPTLSDALAAVRGRVPMFVEVKNSGNPGPLEDAVARELHQTKAPVAVVSFNPLSLGRIARKSPDLPRGQLTGTFEGESVSPAKKLVLGAMLTNWISKPDFIVDEMAALPSFSARLQRLQGRPIVVWVARTAEEYERARKLGDNVIFELDATPPRTESRRQDPVRADDLP